MNHNQSWDMHQPHLSAGPQHAPSTATTGGMPQYSYSQPPLLQPGPNSYASNPYPQYGYANGITSPQPAVNPVSAPMGSGMGSHLLPLPAMTQQPQPPQGQAIVSGGQYAQQTMDTTGQIAPAGMKPRVTATLWEDEGSLCFQVEAKGVCVARRQDNHMINGTKLLNVAGMTRGRRDGILKSEKTRHVVKIGPMHLKGVWIPFERALDFANKEKITELLYPLFVHNIDNLLYHPANQSRTNVTMAAVERRKAEGNGQLQYQNPRVSAPPPLHHHHSMQNPIGAHHPGPALGSHPGPRPSLDRAHTFPTPPTSASSLGMGGHDGSFQWSAPAMGSMQPSQSLSIDTGLSNARSMPTTPATTPPGSTIQNMQQYSGGQTYENSRPSMYSAAPPQQSQYVAQPTVAQQNLARFGAPQGQYIKNEGQYIKNEMGPPSSRAQDDIKPNDGLMPQSQGNGQVGHATGEEEAEHEHDAEYTHDASAGYSANRGPYNTYNAAPPVGALTGEHPHLSPEMTGSPHNSASGRATPRTAPAPASSWGAVQQPGGYHTPPRAAAPATNLYSVMGDQRGPAANGATPNSAYSYPSQPTMNGTKRMREIDDDGDRGSRPGSRGAGEDMDAMKRRKMFREGLVSGVAGLA